MVEKHLSIKLAKDSRRLAGHSLLTIIKKVYEMSSMWSNKVSWHSHHIQRGQVSGPPLSVCTFYPTGQKRGITKQPSTSSISIIENLKFQSATLGLTFVLLLELPEAVPFILQYCRESLAMSEINFWEAREIRRILQRYQRKSLRCFFLLILAFNG